MIAEKTRNVFILSLILLSANVHAQQGDLKLGVRIGGGISVSKEMGKVLVPEEKEQLVHKSFLI